MLDPYLPQLPLLKLCETFNIAVTSYSTFGPASWYELGAAKDMGTLMENQTILSIAKETNKTPAQVILKWALDLGCAVIPKTSNQKRLEENLKCYDFQLSKEQINAITALDRNVRFNDPSSMSPKLSIFA
ncbi:Aldo/keto reductase [Atractiella rhizophila]|nr:Aldo/keto reductase [Atractiella rhizophila]